MYFDFDKMYCGAVRRGDIFLYERERHIKETVLVLQENTLNDGLPTVICALVKPYRKGDEVFANEVLISKHELGVGVDGICMLHKIYTVPRELLVAKKGEIKIETLKSVFKALDINLGRFRD
jgi:mRNA-degrading endonuclease toxin of MazEF toxin-antitoxin module